MKHSMAMTHQQKEQPGWIAATVAAVVLSSLLTSAGLAAATHMVGIHDFYFDPPNLLITTGDTVTWHNYGTNAHSTVHRAPTPLWNSGALGTNAEFSYTFTSAGTFGYFDALFATMKGGIAVSDPTNEPPQVGITYPATGTGFVAPTNLAVQATASDSNGTVTRVEFYANARLLGVATNEPFRIVASNLTAGIYSLTAVATDNGNASATSSVSAITVKSILLNPIWPAKGRFQVTLMGATPAKTSILYASTDLQTWTPIGTNQPSTMATNLTDLEATNQARFYRVMQLP